MISLDYDCSPVKRKFTPQFYGFVPNDSMRRFLVFVCMVLFAALHIALKLLGVALLATLGPIYVSVIMATDLFLFLGYKLLRRDMIYWIPKASWTISISFRVALKILTDFTVSIQHRHLYEMGGLYWSCNLIIGHISCFVAVNLYSALNHAENAIDSSFLWTLVVILELSFVFFFALFLLSIKRSYISTFFTTMTGPQFACDVYRRAQSDEVRFDIFVHNESYYASIREELRVWLAADWERWTVDEKPQWFTPRLLASIPEDLLPKSATQETRERRRKSIDELRKRSILFAPSDHDKRSSR